jgi:hypothetical protein
MPITAMRCPTSRWSYRNPDVRLQTQRPSGDPVTDVESGCRWASQLNGHLVRQLGNGHVKKVAVFGNTGGGKSTLSRRLAELTQIPLYPLDMIQYRAGGARVPHDDYLKAHAELLRRDAWIIDGYGCRTSAWERFACADTLVFIDLPLFTHFLWVTKRLFKGLFGNPRRVADRQSNAQ